MQTQTEFLSRPYIAITHSVTSQTLIRLSIKNTRKSSADNLRLQIDKNFHQYARQDLNIADIYLFKNTIQTFPPNAQLFFPLISSLEYQGPQPENPLSPSLFSITATYSFLGKNRDGKDNY